MYEGHVENQCKRQEKNQERQDRDTPAKRCFTKKGEETDRQKRTKEVALDRKQQEVEQEIDTCLKDCKCEGRQNLALKSGNTNRTYHTAHCMQEKRPAAHHTENEDLLDVSMANDDEKHAHPQKSTEQQRVLVAVRDELRMREGNSHGDAEGNHNETGE